MFVPIVILVSAVLGGELERRRDKWAQGFALGLLLGPIGILIVLVLRLRERRHFTAGSLAESDWSDYMRRTNDAEDAVSPADEESIRRRITLCYCLTVLYGLALIPWPLFLLASAFFFAYPYGPLGLAMVFYIASSVWFYPAYVMCGFLLGKQSAQRGESAFWVAAKSSVPLLSAMWLVPLISVLGAPIFHLGRLISQGSH